MTAAPPASALLGLPGAVAATGPDTGVAWHYGDPIGEQRAAEFGTVVIDAGHRDLITVTGPDRLSWLHTLTSQHLVDAADGTATQALVLSPNGHVEHHFGVTEVGGTTYLDTDPGRGAALLDHLARMVFRSQVTPAAADGFGQLLVAGATAGATATAAGLPAGPAARSLPGGGFVAPRDDGFLVVVPRSAVSTRFAALRDAGARPAGTWAAEALRIAARRPRWGLDTDERTIPNELPWLDSAVHLHKGCYRGQETVARVANLGRPPRRLALLHLDGSVDRLPEVGADVLTTAGRVVGRVGSSAHHHESGPIALALLKRSVPAAEPLLADGVDAALDPAGADDDDPATPRSVIDRRALPDLRRR